MPVGSLKKYMPKNKNEIIFSIIAFLLGALVSCMFLKKKFVLLEGDSCNLHKVEGYQNKKNYYKGLKGNMEGYQNEYDNKDLKTLKGSMEGYQNKSDYKDLMDKKKLYEGYKHGNKDLMGKKPFYKSQKYGKK